MRKKNYTPIPIPELRKAMRENPEILRGRVPGFFLVDKPEGITSHDVVAVVREQLKMRRVGHGGTLDPLATGLLIVFAGNATRLFDDLQDFSKSYEAELQFGVRTDTCDITGEVVEEREVPEISAKVFEEALESFRGEILQTPPMYSSIKKGGRPLHELARLGIEIEREARPVIIHHLEGELCAGNRARLKMSVSKGFYVRTLIDDLGLALSCGATMTALRRTQIGPFDISDATAPEGIVSLGAPEIS